MEVYLDSSEAGRREEIDKIDVKKVSVSDTDSETINKATNTNTMGNCINKLDEQPDAPAQTASCSAHGTTATPVSAK